MRPIHRPPRVPADRHPHCAWTVTIDESHAPALPIPALAINERSRAASIQLAPIDGTDEGQSDYRGPLVSDLDFDCFSRSALARIADEVCLQMHLLDRAFTIAVADRCETASELESIRRNQLVGIAGLGAERLARALRLPSDRSDIRDSALTLLSLHPLLNPAAYVTASVTDGSVVVEQSPAHDDAAWVSLCGPRWFAPMQSIVQALDRHLDVEVVPRPDVGDGAWSVSVVERDDEAPEADAVAIAKLSTGAGFSFERRTPSVAPS
jgi:hypothetical protein